MGVRYGTRIADLKADARCAGDSRACAPDFQTDSRVASPFGRSIEAPFFALSGVLKDGRSALLHGRLLAYSDLKREFLDKADACPLRPSIRSTPPPRTWPAQSTIFLVAR